MRFTFAILSFTFFGTAQAQQLIFEEDFSTGIPAAWYLVNADGLIPATAVDTFDSAWIPFIYDGDTCAASTSYYTPSGQSADYLITPRISLDAFSKLVWSARSYDASYPDGYLVLVSTTDSMPASFTDTVYVKDAENYYWQTRSVQLDLEGYSSEDVFIAFKNVTTDGFILMLDDVKVLSSDFAKVAENDAPQLVVYPNPASTTLNIEGLNPGSELKIYSTTGELVLTTRDNVIDISLLPTGLFIYQITGADQYFSGTFSKQ